MRRTRREYYFLCFSSRVGRDGAARPSSASTDRLHGRCGVRRRRDGAVPGFGLGAAVRTAAVRTAAAVVRAAAVTAAVRRFGGRRVPLGLDHLVRGRLALFAPLQRHDELRDLDEHADQAQPDALEREHVTDERHQRAQHHFEIAQAHVYHFHFVLVVVATAVVALLASACAGEGTLGTCIVRIEKIGKRSKRYNINGKIIQINQYIVMYTYNNNNFIIIYLFVHD